MAGEEHGFVPTLPRPGRRHEAAACLCTHVHASFGARPSSFETRIGFAAMDLRRLARRRAEEEIRKHGGNADIHAAMCADECLAQGDLDAARTWLLILSGINEIVARP